MYNLVNRFAKEIVRNIKPDHVTEYEWLLQNFNQVSTTDYQKRYRNYWSMNVARLSSLFYTTYFEILENASAQKPTLNNILRILHNASVSAGGKKSFQFSFATKLLHMTNPHLPIYSSEVSSFFFFLIHTEDSEQKIINLKNLHNFLLREYARVLKNGLLDEAIREFRQQHKPKHFTDEKIIDSLIWKFVFLLKKGALINQQIVYH